MNTQTTIEKMKQMKLNGMSEVYYRSIQDNLYRDYTGDEFIGLLIDTEWESRQSRKISGLVKAAGFKQPLTTSNINYTAHRNLDKGMFERLLSLQFINQAENIIITGPTGVGKSYLAQVLGQSACQMLKKTLYFNSGQLMEKIKLAKLDGSYIKLLRRIQHSSLLIIDDFGLHPFDTYTRQAFMDIIEDRYDRSSIILTSQIPVSAWYETIGEGTIADAILDRLVYSSHRIELIGDSLRKNKKLKG